MAAETVERTLQEALEQVAGVLSARTVFAADGRLQEVHVLARQPRNPKQVVRDVEAVLAAQFGVELDHRHISVAQIEDEESLDDSADLRLHPRAILVSNGGARAEVKVELISDDGEIYAGQASGIQSEAHRWRLIAKAALAALEDYFGSVCEFILDDVVLFDISTRFTGVLVGITLVTPEGEEGLVGSALVKRDAGEAVVRAVLNAVNRRLVLTTGAQAS
ncbi:MAG TPA: hypothetical protein GXX28_10790 [Firmicutes bacterium]|nr:hypothetical protein [Bacillota bacterium]